MAQQSVGSSDNLNVGRVKINDNFTDIYDRVATPATQEIYHDTSLGGVIKGTIGGELSMHIGYSVGALASTVDGGGNTFLGYQAGLVTFSTATEGYHNVFIGGTAGILNTSGSQNTFVGHRSGVSNTTGQQNTFLGQGAGFENTTQDSNDYFGFHAGLRARGTKNVCMGNEAGQGSLTPASNTASNNTMIGWRAGYSTAMTTAGNIVSIGAESGSSLTTALQNVFIGNYAGFSVTSGGGNIVIGWQAGLTNTGANTLTTGANNTFVGYQSGQSSTTQVSKSGALGYRAKVSGSNMFAIGGATSGDEVMVGINMVTPSAWLHLPAGTATAGTAPLKLISGTNLTTPENGAFEFDGTNLYFTSGGTRKTITMV